MFAFITQSFLICYRTIFLHFFLLFAHFQHGCAHGVESTNNLRCYFTFIVCFSKRYQNNEGMFEYLCTQLTVIQNISF